MSELPSHFVAQEPTNLDSASEKLLDPKLMQAQLLSQTIQRFQALNGEIAKISDFEQQEAARAKLDALALKEYGKTWEVLRYPDVEVIPMIVGGKSGEELKSELLANKVDIEDAAEDLLSHPAFEARRLRNQTPLLLAVLKPSHMGFWGTPSIRALYAQANEWGFTLLPPDVGPIVSIRSEFKGLIGMEPINDRNGMPNIFAPSSTNGSKELWASDAGPSEWTTAGEWWMFGLPLNTRPNRSNAQGENA